MGKEVEKMGLKIENLKVALQKEDILREVSLCIEDGEFVSLLGASGCGKTTLLKSIAGLLEIESGDIVLEGYSIINTQPEKRGAVIVFQDLRLFPHMTVEKNITFPMELKKVPKKEQKDTVKRLLDAVQLTGFEKRKIKEMSGGQMQRVALARALAADPRLLLLDEPFSGLDERLRAEMGSLVKRLHKEWKITTVLVTHDKREALQMSDRIALMSDGRILQYSTPEQMFYNPNTPEVADYFGKTNYINGIVKDGVFESACFKLPVQHKEGAYRGMIRPFALRIFKGENMGVIREIVFMGETAELVMETADGELVSQMMSSETATSGFTVGEAVGVRIAHPELLRLFP